MFSVRKATPNVIACNITRDRQDHPVITDVSFADPGRANHFVMGSRPGTPVPEVQWNYKWPPPQDRLFAAVYKIRVLDVMFTIADGRCACDCMTIIRGLRRSERTWQEQRNGSLGYAFYLLDVLSSWWTIQAQCGL